MRFCVLGPLEAFDGERALAVGAGRQRALLALLLVHAGEVVSRDRLIDELWSGAPPPSAAQSLDTHVSRLRRGLRAEDGTTVVVTRDPGYVLNPASLDAQEFEELAGAGREALAAGDSGRAATLLGDALAMWRGAAYMEVADEPWARPYAERLEQLRLAATEDRIDAELRLGRHQALVPELELLAARHPMRERLVGQLMLALYRCGRQADALDVYQAARTSLVEQLGLEPGPGLRELQAAVLAHDDGLRLTTDQGAQPPVTRNGGQGIAIIVFSDLVDSTAMLARLGDDRMDRILRAHLADIRVAVESAGGRLVKSTGDGAMATFASGLSALQAAAAIQHSVVQLDESEGTIGLAARVGVSAGEPIVSNGDLSGISVVIAARLCGAARPGEVLVHEVAQSLVASRDGATFGERAGYELKGIPGTTAAAPLQWRGLDVDHVQGEAPNAAPTPEPAPPALPRMLTSFSAEPLVGRDEQLGLLRDAVSFAEARRAVLLLGEPGIGKTRLAAAAAEYAHEAGALVVLARCPPEAATAYEPWVRALGEIALGQDPVALAAAAGAELAALVPELAEYAPARAAGASTETLAAEGARYRLLRGVGAALAHAAGDRPVCIVLDDAHWCDAASTQVLGEILERAPFDRLALVVTARDRDLGRGHPVSRALTELKRTRDLRELKLDGLDANGLAALVSARVGRAITPRLAARLLARTKGNPFFAGELARDLDDRDALHDDKLDSAPVPDAVAGLVDERLARLDEATERFLVAAAAIGPTAPVALVATAAGLDPAVATAAVVQAVAERLVDEAPAPEPAVTFPHALVREAFAAMPEAAAAARLHHAIAEALSADPGAEPADLARHRALAAPVTGPGPAVAAHRNAATAAATGHDHEAAAAHLDHALALMPPSDADRGRLLLALGDERILAVDLRRARVAYAAAVEAARTTRDAKLLGEAALGFAGGAVGFNWEIGADDPQVATLLREALAALDGEEPQLELGLIFRLLYVTVYERGEAGRSALVDRARRLAEGRDDALTQLQLRAIRFGSAFAYSPDVLDATDTLAEWLELVPLAEQAGRDDWLLRTLTWAAHAASVEGDFQRCDELIDQAEVVAERLGTPRFTWEVEQLRAERMIGRGEMAAGLQRSARACATIGRLRPDIQTTMGLSSRLGMTVFYHDNRGVAAAAFQSISAASDWGAMTAFVLWFQSLNGETEAAWAAIDRVLDSDFELLRSLDGTFPVALACTAYAAAEIGHQRAGERIRPLLERFRSRNLTLGPSVMFNHPTEFAIGRLEMLAGRHQSAAEELHTAVARADDLDIDFLRPWARVELARALFRGGEPSDLEPAQRALAEAVEIANASGHNFALREVAKLRAEMEGRPLATLAPPQDHTRPLRALATRSGRRALATLVRGLGDEALEERFIAPRRQRALLRAMARGFQPGNANGFQGVIAYELEPFAVDAPPDAPWRWAIEMKGTTARVIEPAPIDAAVTIYFGLADFVRVIAGDQDPITLMAAGRCRVEGDLEVAALLEPMFGAR